MEETSSLNSKKVSDPVFITELGWFRYNYENSQLEFINQKTRLIVEVWRIPTDQWNDLPSQRQYCENIYNSELQKAKESQQQKNKYYKIFILSAIITAILAVINLYFYVNNEVNYSIIIAFISSFSISSGSYYKYKLS